MQGHGGRRKGGSSLVKGINTGTKDFENGVTSLINSSGLPPCILRLVLEKLLSQICEIEAHIVEQENNAQEKTKTTEEDGS